MHHTSTAGESSAAQTQLPISFTGSGSEYFRIWIVNLLLTFVTLGLYYPWAKATNRATAASIYPDRPLEVPAPAAVKG